MIKQGTYRRQYDKVCMSPEESEEELSESEDDLKVQTVPLSPEELRLPESDTSDLEDKEEDAGVESHSPPPLGLLLCLLQW